MSLSESIKEKYRLLRICNLISTKLAHMYWLPARNMIIQFVQMHTYFGGLLRTCHLHVCKSMHILETLKESEQYTCEDAHLLHMETCFRTWRAHVQMYTYFGDLLGIGSDHICICTKMYFKDLLGTCINMYLCADFLHIYFGELRGTSRVHIGICTHLFWRPARNLHRARVQVYTDIETC